MSKITILVLNFNGYKNTIDCYKSLERLTVPKESEIEIIIIDNGSDDGSFSKLSNALPKAKIIDTGQNLGFSGGNNFGIKEALNSGSDYIVILNNDTRVDGNLVKNLYDSIRDDAKAGVVLPKIYFEKGYEFHSKYKDSEKGKVIWYAGGIMDWANLVGSNKGVDEVDTGQFEKRVETGLATGCCFMVKAEVLRKVGLFDEKYFLYYEDADLSERIKKAGYKLYFEPKAIVWHKNAESSGGSGSNLQDYFITRNRMLFGMKYAPARTKFALLREGMRLLIGGRKWQKRGIVDFYIRKFGCGSYQI